MSSTTFATNADGAGGTAGFNVTVPGTGSQTVLVDIGGECTPTDNDGCSIAFEVKSGSTVVDAASVADSWTIVEHISSGSDAPESGSRQLALTLTGGTTYTFIAEYATETAGTATVANSDMVVQAY